MNTCLKNAFARCKNQAALCLISVLLLLRATSAMASVEAWGEVRMLSDIGDPLSAEIDTFHHRKDIDASCFSVKSFSPDNPVILDFTLTAPLQGVLRLWTTQALSGEARVTLINRCESTQRAFTLTQDNQVIYPDTAVSSTPVPSASTEAVAPPEIVQPVAAPVVTEAPPKKIDNRKNVTPAVSEASNFTPLLNELLGLREQLASFKLQMNTLYQSHVSQGELLKQLQSELVTLRKENHWLRSAAFSLLISLLISSYFFADWLKRRSAESATEETALSATDTQQHDIPAFKLTPVPKLTAETLPATAETQIAEPRSTAHAYIAPAFAKKVSLPELDAGPDEQLSCASSITRLQQHLHKHPKQSPRVWLYLLDKLKREGQQTAYDTAAQNCRKYFNIEIEAFDAPIKAGKRSISLESFPRLCDTLQTIWGTAETLSFVDDLIHNTRLVPRIGFQRAVFEELLLLKDIALQTLDISQPSPSPALANSKDDNLKTLSKLEDEIAVLPAITPSEFQYWSEFSFELDDAPALRKLA